MASWKTSGWFSPPYLRALTLGLLFSTSIYMPFDPLWHLSCAPLITSIRSRSPARLHPGGPWLYLQEECSDCMTVCGRSGWIGLTCNVCHDEIHWWLKKTRACHHLMHISTVDYNMCRVKAGWTPSRLQSEGRMGMRADELHPHGLYTLAQVTGGCRKIVCEVNMLTPRWIAWVERRFSWESGYGPMWICGFV